MIFIDFISNNILIHISKLILLIYFLPQQRERTINYIIDLGERMRICK